MREFIKKEASIEIDFKRNMKFIIYISHKNLKEAKKVAEHLLEEKLIASCILHSLCTI